MRTVGPWVAARLVRGDDVAEAARVVEDVVPAEGEAAVGGPAGERQVRDEPRRVLEGAQEGGGLSRHGREDLRRGVARQRVDDVPGRHLDDLVPRHVEPADRARRRPSGRRRRRRPPVTIRSPAAFARCFDEAAVPLGPGQERRRAPRRGRPARLRAGARRSSGCRPRRRCRRARSRSRRGSVLGEPEEARAREAAARQPLAHRDPVEGGPLGVVGGAAAAGGRRRGAPSRRAAAAKRSISRSKRESSARSSRRGAGARVEPLVPPKPRKKSRSSGSRQSISSAHSGSPFASRPVSAPTSARSVSSAGFG